ncbi:hypothetical protein BaRGS_00034486 [Batillaria attramentaria]|uniref:Secreted protein n=1 Tax=Batillaria attramentaria TaxID=370345 RepID=A0ABD0JHR7_9CAEN
MMRRTCWLLWLQPQFPRLQNHVSPQVATLGIFSEAGIKRHLFQKVDSWLVVCSGQGRRRGWAATQLAARHASDGG